MSETGARLLAEIGGAFNKRMKTDREFLRLAGKIPKSADYGTAGDYAVRAGELLSQSIIEHVEDLPTIPRELAEELLPPLLSYDHDLVAEAARIVQENMNAEADLNIEALTAGLDTNRIDGLVDKVSSYEDTADSLWVLREPVVNYSQAVTDQTLKKNAEVSAKLGVERYIVRTAEAAGIKYRKATKGHKRGTAYSVPCEWCSGLAGRYVYKGSGGNIPRSVYQRHSGCRCTLTFENGNERQNVWDHSQKWSADDAEGQKRAVQRAEAQRRAETQTKVENAEKRARDVQNIMEREGWDAKTAAIWRNKNVDAINQAGSAENYLNGSDAQRKIWRQAGEVQYIMQQTKWTERQAYTWWQNNRGDINRHGLRAALRSFIS